MQVDWDTGGKNILNSVKNTQVCYINILHEDEDEPEPGRQPEGVGVDWDTGGKEILNPVRNTQVYYINIPWQQQEQEQDLGHALYLELEE